VEPIEAQLRILILSTPKTGNTWLSRLLASVYDLPQVGLVTPFDPQQARWLGNRWILFHHLRPSAEILEWIEEIEPVLVTAVRHPADVLVSLYYHLREFRQGAIDLDAVRAMLAEPFERKDIACDATGSFRDDLECSLGWVRTGKAHVVRYEDLWRDVHGELTRLTSLISPVPASKIDLAIERSDFSLMRRLAGGHGGFFRSGKVGSWVEALPQEVLDEFEKEPYRSLVAELGYSMDPTHPIITRPRVPRTSINPFRRSTGHNSEGSVLDDREEEARFDNGVPVTALLVDLYLALSTKHDWKGQPSSTGPGSYYEWLNQPCYLPGRGVYGQVLITNIALQVHSLRPDVNQTFVDLEGPARADFADWFVRYVTDDVELDRAFIDPIRDSLNQWAWARSPDDREAWPWWPTLPNFAMHLYKHSEELQSAYPDILCFDRWSYLEWILEHQQEANINPEYVQQVRKSLKKLAKLRSVGRYIPGARVRVSTG